MVLLLISLSTNENNVTFKIYYNNNIYRDTMIRAAVFIFTPFKCLMMILC